MTPLPDTRADLVSMTHPELERFLTDLGKERYRATQVMKWIHQGLTESFQSMTNLSKSFREEISTRALIQFPEVLKILESNDGTTKFLLGLRDGCAIESVLIPGDDHDTLCISTQVGCSMGCRICRTARRGLVRNLTAGEIVSQLLVIRRMEPERRITNIVFMGMGEPLANFANTVKAIRILTHPHGPQISWRHVTVSTCGLVPGIRDLGRQVKAKLAVSLNAVTDEQRIRAKVNLIPLNDGAVTDFTAPAPERVQRFQDILMSRSLVTIVRRSRGQDILAACGQLAGEGIATR
ncbi:MAG: 23S rRNA (adenine(2503)-C(2))-methyltransferase RlmN [Deltaproteobacteria bacterium]